MKNDKPLALPQSASSDGLVSGRQPTNTVLTRERLEEIKRVMSDSRFQDSYAVPELLAFIEDHLLPIVKAAQSEEPQGWLSENAKRIIDEGGY